MKVRHYVFGYASLVEHLVTRPTREPRPEGFVTDLRGHRREWAVAMDNSRDLPAYKYYVDPATGKRPAVHVTFLDLEPDARSAVNGVAFPVADLEALDARERNYARRDVSDLLSTPPPGPTWAYFGTPEAHARHRRAVATGTAVVDHGYLDLVREGFAELGAEELDRYSASTAAPRVPLMKLERVDVPPA